MLEKEEKRKVGNGKRRRRRERRWIKRKGRGSWLTEMKNWGGKEMEGGEGGRCEEEEEEVTKDIRWTGRG